jgi:hypothetical protein
MRSTIGAIYSRMQKTILGIALARTEKSEEKRRAEARPFL